MNRRSFLARGGAGLGALAARPPVAADAAPADVDFRYSPLEWQTAYCFPDDPHKSLVGHHGELRYGNPGRRGADYFPVVVEFSLRGMEPDVVARQELEAPGVPIVHTRLERPEGFLELTAFATNRSGEGRVDNVLLTVRPKTARSLAAAPVVTIRTGREVSVERSGGSWHAYLGAGADRTLLMVSERPLARREMGWGWQLQLGSGAASAGQPLRCLLRFPQAAGSLPPAAGAEELLAEAHMFWSTWRPFGGELTWKMPGVYDRFLTACARNILQAREERDGKLTFQVGPTCYRGLWVVDGHFILEAARYLGYDAEAQQGLETTWGYQKPSGTVSAGAGETHWKDTAIAMFSLVRQAELAGDWSYFERMRPGVLRGVEFLSQLRERARREGGPNGRYGLLARGMGDGGLGTCAEFTNTLWSLAGLQAVAQAAQRRKIGGFEPAGRLGAELRAAFDSAARQEMLRHPDGFEYLPMLMAGDPLATAGQEWERPKPQAAQWALSHAIYPGLVFAREDPIVRGHIALMQAVTREDVPAETGWIVHEGLWTYNAPFVAHVYLWAGEKDWARSTFHGFLNHASPLYCWREEQPFRGSLVSNYVGDMPHNWASAECVLYLRHMLALEDGSALRLLAGLGAPELAMREPFAVEGSPTRFGRLRLRLEPDGRAAWHCTYELGAGPAPSAIELPARVGAARFVKAEGARATEQGERVLVDPAARSGRFTWS